MENVLKKLIALYPDRHIKVTGGRELIAEKRVTEDFVRVKTEHCNLCGACCHDFPSTVYGNDPEGRCKALVAHGDTWECGAGVAVPYNCLDDPADVPECCIKFRKVKVK